MMRSPSNLEQPRSNDKNFIELLLILVILALAGYLRLAHIETNPGWYSDEGTLINIAQNLMQGKVQYLAINQSILIVGRPPLFVAMLAVLFRIFGDGIETLRVFTGSLGVISVGLLYWVVRRMLGRKGIPLALLSALMLAIYPQAIFYNRLGFSYNLLMPMALLTFWGLWEYLNTMKVAWLVLAALAVGLGGASDLMMFTFAPVVVLVVSTRRWRDLLWALPLIALPFSLYALVMLITVPQAFLFDLNFTLFRLGEVPWFAQFPIMVLNYGTLLIQNLWFALAIIGFFLLPRFRIKMLSLLMFFVPIVLLGRTISLTGLGLNYISPLFPFVAMGAAALFIEGWPLVLEVAQNGFNVLFKQWGWIPQHKNGRWVRARAVVLGSSLVFFLIIITPVLISAFLSVFQVQNGLSSGIDNLLVNAIDAGKVADYVNQHSEADDVVLTSPAISWLFDSQIADFQMAIAAEGKATKHFPADIPLERFAFDPRYTQARYVVIDPVWRNWAAANMPEVEAMIADVKKWTLVFQSGEIDVYENPVK